MYKLRYLAQAKDDIIGIKRYIAKGSGSQKIALEYTNRLRAQCRKLADRTRSELRHDLRSSTHGNYVIFFQYNADSLVIVSIIEGHRDIDALFDT